MSYRCKVCRAANPPGTTRRVWVVYRTVRSPTGIVREEVEREVPVCVPCLRALESGTPAAELAERAVRLAELRRVIPAVPAAVADANGHDDKPPPVARKTVEPKRLTGPPVRVIAMPPPAPPLTLGVPPRPGRR